MIGNGNTYNKQYTDVVGFVAAFYEHRSVIKHAKIKLKCDLATKLSIIT